MIKALHFRVVQYLIYNMSVWLTDGLGVRTEKFSDKIDPIIFCMGVYSLNLPTHPCPPIFPLTPCSQHTPLSTNSLIHYQPNPPVHLLCLST